MFYQDDSSHFISVNIFCSEHVFSKRKNFKPIKLQDFREICSLAQKISLRARKRCLSNKNIMKGIVLSCIKTVLLPYRRNMEKSLLPGFPNLIKLAFIKSNSLTVFLHWIIILEPFNKLNLYSSWLKIIFKTLKVKSKPL